MPFIPGMTTSVRQRQIDGSGMMFDDVQCFAGDGTHFSFIIHHWNRLHCATRLRPLHTPGSAAVIRWKI
jgi:hypothetical protein